MLRFSPWPSFLWIFRSFCCNEIKTSSSSFVMSNKYCKRGQTGVNIHVLGHMDTTGCEERRQHLWVLQERQLVVSAASTAVQQRLCIFSPAPKVHDLMPCLMNADHWCIDQTANVCICEELAPVGEGHPVTMNRKRLITPEEVWGAKLSWWMDFFTGTHQNSPSSSTVMPRLPLSVSPTLDHSSELTANSEQNKSRCYT